MPDLASSVRTRSPVTRLRPLLMAAAVMFCALTALYSFEWIRDARHPPHAVELGFNMARATFFDPATNSIQVYNVAPASPAESAGLQSGDHIIGLNEQALTSYELFDRVWTRSHPGDTVDLTIRRPGLAEPITIHGTFRQANMESLPAGSVRAGARQILSLFPVFFVLIGFAVLFLRLDNAHAWLLALLFAAFIAVPNFNDQLLLPELPQKFTALYRNVFSSLITPLFYVFFAVFPVKSPLERLAPWLKWVALGFAALEIVPGLPFGESDWPAVIKRLVGQDIANHARGGLHYGWLAVGLISLVWNCYGVEVPQDAKRKSRVLLLGTLAGVLPIALERFFIDFYGFRPPFWVDLLSTLLILLYPLSFAYAVVQYRVLEIPVLLRNSVRYLLVQRGYFLLLICGGLLAIVLFARFFSGYFADNSQYGMALSAAFGIAMVWVSSPFVKRGTERIDRAFFRSSYNARVILEDLAEKIRKVNDRRELARLIERHLTQAFHPRSLAIYFADNSGRLTAADPEVPASISSFVPDAPWLRDVIARGGAWDVPPPGDPDAPPDFLFKALAPECIVPLLTQDSRLAGLLALGQPRSEEPYSRGDKRLLDSVTSQAVISLENMRMAEQIADRLEGDRRAAHEMHIARDVQARLFPQVMPPLTTLEYTGSCLQARQVGGDYYDFLDLGSSHRMERGATHALDAAAWHLAFVLADISGKGIAGALLMANLQANLRSRYALALDDLPRLLRSVNQLFYENTPDDRYATLFFGVYDDHSRELEYANCGHNAPLLFRADGKLERLTSTSTVIGLFADWRCETRFVKLEPGDLLVIFTDGVTEAIDAAGNEFGEARLIEMVWAHRQQSPVQLVTAIQEAVQKFSSGEQSDDLTLLIARAR